MAMASLPRLPRLIRSRCSTRCALAFLLLWLLFSLLSLLLLVFLLVLLILFWLLLLLLRLRLGLEVLQHVFQLVWKDVPGHVSGKALLCVLLHFTDILSTAFLVDGQVGENQNGSEGAHILDSLVDVCLDLLGQFQDLLQSRSLSLTFDQGSDPSDKSGRSFLCNFEVIQVLLCLPLIVWVEDPLNICQ